MSERPFRISIIEYLNAAPLNFGFKQDNACTLAGQSNRGGQSGKTAADPNSTRGLIAGALTPGQSRSQSFVVNAGLNKFFTFATMVITE